LGGYLPLRLSRRQAHSGRPTLLHFTRSRRERRLTTHRSIDDRAVRSSTGLVSEL